jgi:hypothetical protein
MGVSERDSVANISDATSNIASHLQSNEWPIQELRVFITAVLVAVLTAPVSR